MAQINVIKWENTQTELIHKFAVDDLRFGSQLVVYPGQIAFFVKGGRVYDEFSSGTYTLHTENIPLLNKVYNLPFGGKSPFQAEVWFVNTVSLLDFKWGTSTPIQIEDPKYHVIIPVRAYGQYGLKVNDARLLLERLAGNMPSLKASVISDYFRGVILSKLTNIISTKLYEENLSVVNINSHLEMISEYALLKLRETFAEYGIGLEMFVAIAITVDESDPSFRKLKEIKDSLATITIMGTDNYRLKRGFDVLESAAENEGGGIVSTAVGMGAGLGIGANIGAIFNENMPTLGVMMPTSPGPVNYYLGIDGAPHGPFCFDHIKAELETGRIDGATPVWKKGMAAWKILADMPEFDALINFPPPIPDSLI